MKITAFVINTRKEKNIPDILEIIKYTQKKDAIVMLLKKEAETLSLPHIGYAPAEIRKKASIIISLGGDGTLLRAVRHFIESGQLFFPINLGSLGFLSVTGKNDAFGGLDRLFMGDFKVDERMVSRARLYRGKKLADTFNFLNDLVISKGSYSRIISLELFQGKIPVSVYNADGLIISTPTGSTAYSLSAGGPVMHPRADVLCVTPISAHTLTLRPLVLPASEKISVLVSGRTEKAFLSADGQDHIELLPGDIVHIERSPKKAKIVNPAGINYFDIMRYKLNWGK